MATLPLSFYRRYTVTVARELLGKKLVHLWQGQRLSGYITEVEAYLGINDKAAHSYNHRRTSRTEIMYAEGGHAYIYLIYGMHNCLNVVTESKGVPEAVLIRALEPSEGVEMMQIARKSKNIKNLTSGPGKLTQALNLTRDLNGALLTSEEIFIEEGRHILSPEIIATPRIGVDYAEDHALWPLRFLVTSQS